MPSLLNVLILSIFIVATAIAWRGGAAPERAVATTIMALPPVIMLPQVWMWYKERISLRSAIGAALAVAGVAVLFLR